ncbi:MAG: glycyl-radical enzyme activating protein [Proteobacteria bacterium]|nr:glycyl-radical enzyme activating protein [Pseudomonadota bacterium]MBU1698151.1 glycyl-radical enzyme activating protein [Pseudomonadota bacterium]
MAQHSFFKKGFENAQNIVLNKADLCFDDLPEEFEGKSKDMGYCLPFLILFSISVLRLREVGENDFKNGDLIVLNDDHTAMIYQVQNPYVFKIQRYSIHDGPGIRTTLFFQGCPLSCCWCHNPESQAMPLKINMEEMDKVAAFLMEEIEKDLIFYDDSGGGVTFSGGEPLCQPQLLFRLLDLCREKQIHTCVDTSGYGEVKTLLKVAQKADLILYDIKLIDETAHKKYTGQGVDLVLDNLKQLSKQKAAVRLRFPLIPQMTDTDENIGRIIAFLKENTIYRDIHILPFHRAGQGKYEALNIINYMKDIQPPSDEMLAKVKEQFESNGFSVTLGG